MLLCMLLAINIHPVRCELRDAVTMITRIYRTKDPEKEGEHSLLFEVNRVNYDRLLDTAIPHLDSRDKIQRLDLFWMLDELQRLRRKQYNNSVAGNGFFISKTHKDGNGKYAPLKVERVRNRIRDMFKRHNIS